MIVDELNLDDLMCRLAAKRAVFHSEADFQHALAWKIHELISKAKVRLEVSSGRFDKRERIDILIRDGGAACAIELKYKKKKLQCECGGEVFSLLSDGAQDIGRYDFIKDIARLERYVDSEINTTGYAILLTNDDLYWRESNRGKNSAAFFLHEGRALNASVPPGLARRYRTGHSERKDRFFYAGDEAHAELEGLFDNP